MTDQRMAVPPFVISTELEDSVVVLNLNSKRYYILNVTAGFIWHEITEGRSKGEIIDKMTVIYDATQDQITTSVGRLFDTLEKAGLLMSVDHAPR
jgi:hypothetical protein